MGNQNQSCNQEFLSNLSQATLLEPQEMIHASDLEQVIFHNNNIASQYFIRLIITPPQGPSLEAHKEFLDWLMDNRNYNVVPLVHYRIRRCPVTSVSKDIAKIICSNQEMLESYYLFSNFCLREVVKRGFVSRNNRRFREEELWHIAQALVAIVKYFKRRNVAVGGFTSRDVMLTPEGGIQFYPNKLRIDNSHAVFFEVIRSTEALDEAYLPPEQLLHLRKGSYILPDLITTLKIGDVFNIGMLLLECMTLESSDRYYNTKRIEFNSSLLDHKLRSLREARMVSCDFLEFVEKCLDTQTSRRVTLEEAERIIGKHPQSKCLTFLSPEPSEKSAATDRKESDLTAMTSSGSSLRIRNR